MTPETPSDPVHRASISSIRRATIVAGATAALAVPMALLTLPGGEAPPGRRHVASGEPAPGRTTSDEGHPLRPASDQGLLAPGVDRARAEVDRIRGLPSPAVLDLARTGSQEQRLVALNVLWSRGSRSEVEEVVAGSGDRALTAKLAALRAARR